MKTRFVSCLAVVIFGLAGTGRSDEPESEASGRIPSAILERFDADKNGSLSPQERRTARQAMERLQQDGQRLNLDELLSAEMRKRFDENSNGELEPQEMAKAREELKRRLTTRAPDRAQLIKRFDQDGDGQLDPEERRQMRQSMARGRGGAGAMKASERKPRLDQSSLLEKFDADNDGKLGPEERQQIVAELRKRRST